MSEIEEAAVVAMALGQIAVGTALGTLNYERPVLFVHAVNVGIGHQVATIYNLNLALHEGDPCAWWIEWQGRRVGSIGC